MTAHLSSPTSTKYFTHPWTLTTPSHPNITFHRATPSDFPSWIPLVTNPSNNIHMSDFKSMAWTPSEITAWKTHNINSYNESLTKFNHLSIMISENEKVMGYADLFLLPIGNFNVGIVLNSTHHRLGIGKFATRVLIQLAFLVGNSRTVEAGTMKSNAGFRGIMRGLGVEEEEKLVVVEGRGVLAEVSYEIHNEGWREVELNVVWGEGSLERVEDGEGA